jgi:hypothetical protein
VDFIKESGYEKIFKPLAINYEKYAAGEAALAWLDALVTVRSKREAVKRSYEFIEDIAQVVLFQQLPVGHLKFFLQSGSLQQKISFISGDDTTTKDRDENIVADHATVLVNARVETNPDHLKEIFYTAIRKLENQGCYVEALNLASFQPGYPKPTYRLS